MNCSLKTFLCPLQAKGRASSVSAFTARPCSHQVVIIAYRQNLLPSAYAVLWVWIMLQERPISELIIVPLMQLFRSRVPLKVVAARVGGVEIPNNKHVEFSVRYIYGIGPTTARSVVAETVSHSS